MSEPDGHAAFRSSLRQQPPAPPPQMTLPSIPQLPPISLASSPSMESFTTALSSTSRDRDSPHVQRRALDHSTPSLSFTPPASPSAALYSSHPRQIRAAASVQHLRTQPPPPRAEFHSEVSDYSDLEPGSFSNRATPVPANYRTTPVPTRRGSDVERHPHARRYDSERDEAYQSTASTSRGGTMSDSHAQHPARSLSSRPSSSAFQARLQALSTTSASASSSSGSSFFGSNPRSPSSPTTRRDVPPPQPPPNKPLPSPAARVVNRARSASLLGMVSTVASIGTKEKEQEQQSRSSASVQNLQKPRLTLYPAPINTRSSSPPPPEFTILVVGSPQCGKSILLSKGLKSWNIEKERRVTLGSCISTVQVPASFSASFASSGSSFPSGSSAAGMTIHTVTHEIHAISRIAHVAIKNGTYPIETLEVGSQQLFLAGPAWPAIVANGQWVAGQTTVAAGVDTGVATAMGLSSGSGAGTTRGRVVDGLVVCYDTSDSGSWECAKMLLEHASHAYINQPIQAIVAACKTDLLNPPVLADHTEYHPQLSGQSSDADQYQIGMPESVVYAQARSHRRHSSSDDGHGAPGGNPDERRSTSTAGAGMIVGHKNLGLVPVARTEGMGKKKMRDLFNWLLRRVERAKRHRRAALAAQSHLSRPAASHRSPSPARTPTPTPPSVDAPVSLWPAPVSGSTPPTTTTDRHPPSNGSAGLGGSSTTSSVPLSPLSAFSSPGTGSAGLHLNLSHQPQQQASSAQSPTNIRSPRSPASPTRARSTSDLTLEYTRGSSSGGGSGGKAAAREEQDREYVAMVAAARANGNTSGVGSGTERERSSGSVMGRKTSASVSNLRSRAENASVSASGGSPTAIAGRASMVASGVKAALSSVASGAGNNGGGDGDGSRHGSTTGVNGNGEVPRNTSINVSMLPMKPKEPPPLQYATLDELLDKLVFLGIAGDEPVFSDQFFLVYRRFATPRSVLLGFQKRMRELSTMTDDLLMAKYAQMRICSLLEEWMDKFPGDFATSGAEPALHALIRQLLSLCHTAHYGSDFMSFLETVPELSDEEKAWALKEDWRRDDDGPSDVEADDSEAEALRIARTVSVSIAVSMGGDQSADSLPRSAGDPVMASSHKLPHSAPMTSLAAGASSSSQVSKSSTPHVPMFGDYNPAKGLRRPDAVPGTKPNMKELLKASQAIAQKPPHFVAEEITRLEVPMFLSVQPRDWLRHGLGEKGHEAFPDTITRMAKFYNYLTLWTASLILVHEKPRARAKQIEFFIRVAVVLRKLNNYSGLRAVVMGISTSRTDRDLDPVMAYIKDRQLWRKEFKSLETLLGTSRMHSAYRMALRHAFEAAIPSMEIHTYDLIRADDTNPDYKPGGDGTLIHWGKFAMMSKMVLNVVSYQDMFPDTTAFTFPERSEIRELVMNVIIMDDDTLYSRIVMPIEAHSGGPLSDGGGATSRFRQIFARH